MATQIAKNTTWLSGSLVLQKILSFAYFWFISNHFYPGAIGKYVFALSFTTFFSIFVDLGLSVVLTREGAKSNEQANKYLRSIIGLKLILAVVATIIAILVINITGKELLTRRLVYLALIVMLLDSFTFTFYAIFRSRHNLRYESIGSVIFQVINFSLGAYLALATNSIRYLLFALITASTFNFIFSFILLKKKLNFSLKPNLSKEVISYFIHLLPAFALTGIFVKIYNTSDSILLSFLATDASVGFFAIPAKVISAIQAVIAGSFAAVIYPAFSHAFVKSKQTLTHMLRDSIRYLMILSFPIGFGLAILAPEIISQIWPEYTLGIATFTIMSLAIPFIFLAFVTGSLLNACDRQKNVTINRGFITALAVLINLILIPRLQHLGAGITFLIVNMILLYLDFRAADKVVKIKSLKLQALTVKVFLSTAVMSLLIYYLRLVLPLFFVVANGAIIYFVLIYALKGITRHDINELKLIFKKANV
ncbi:MAG: hypothetical protein COT81_03205 [Candidatus Buchananbacteria bacterium CG10_big_fil_rev_8_21_14_0_10_42_9]|uniref:Uncharacterized protein n=1 Tax=Candidatus Buchananbacteria bacterium CG10_big_fil_rev_8_21_14_0_10_42_9 TaxID=1974526 RepID=A0A2H0W115_9BACT|nr:MAG: hypothetical protein COT81_03205 [Candidatus Buchananbacteria bacterium CG10_big_fil_rev_8_21_14_0_10_42_9]